MAILVTGGAGYIGSHIVVHLLEMDLIFKYYENNVYVTIVLQKEIVRASVKKIVFSYSATVFGTPKNVTQPWPIAA